MSWVPPWGDNARIWCIEKCYHLPSISQSKWGLFNMRSVIQYEYAEHSTDDDDRATSSVSTTSSHSELSLVKQPALQVDLSMILHLLVQLWMLWTPPRLLLSIWCHWLQQGDDPVSMPILQWIMFNQHLEIFCWWTAFAQWRTNLVNLNIDDFLFSDSEGMPGKCLIGVWYLFSV